MMKPQRRRPKGPRQPDGVKWGGGTTPPITPPGFPPRDPNEQYQIPIPPKMPFPGGSQVDSGGIPNDNPVTIQPVGPATPLDFSQARPLRWGPPRRRMR